MNRNEIVDALRTRPATEPIVAAWLFGSVARGDANAASDVDLALLGWPPPKTLAEAPYALAADLSGSLGREVDVVRVEDGPRDLVMRILADGILLVDNDRAARIRFEVDARNRYYDMLPIWREYRKAAGG